MPSTILLSGSGARRRRSTRKRQVQLPKLPRAGRRKARPALIPTTATATASERAALQSLAQRLQRGSFAAWRSANYGSPAAQEAARLAAQTGAPATATDLVTGTTVSATPLGGTGSRRRRRKTSTRTRRPRSHLRGGFLPALIPIIAAAIGAIPGIAGTAVGIASLKEQQRQFNRLYGKSS
ncbi:pX core protein precursor [Psittacine aviadenovirus B]|uniref:PX core protein n=1 Tax=psittacine adenovirus 4 TaxID=2773287 RepID=A0A1P8SW78_9ADEN|nr:pX core protein precursor [Psittacine aviadenovirus B]APY28352.1 pX core protein precursor [psittacine adenovirus 4]